MNINTRNSATLNILHLEDCELDHELVKHELRRSGIQFEIVRIETLEAFAHEIQQTNFDAILADYRLAGFTALDAWQLLKDSARKTPFILISGAIGEAAAVQAIQTGIHDYLPKEDISKLARVLDRAIEIHNIQLEKENADKELAASEQRLANFAEHLQSTIEQERSAIAREIHDDIGGSIAAVRFDLSWVTRHTADPAVLEHLKAANEMLAHALSASQRIMLSLRPAVLDQGLLAAVEWLAQGFTRRTNVPVTIQAPQTLAVLDKAVQLTAYRTAQEALTNISKYAQCSQVQIELSDAEGVLTLEITDNGAGLGVKDLTKETSFGIRGLKERARTVGGWLDVSSQPDRGTSIILSVPFAKRTHDHEETSGP